jgi:hypothetical protein
MALTASKDHDFQFVMGQGAQSEAQRGDFSGSNALAWRD